MNVLSVCDGMSCGQIALRELGIKVDNYYASEIDKFAIKQTKHNFPDTVQLGDMVFLRYAMTWKKDTVKKMYNSEYVSLEKKQNFFKLRSMEWHKINLVIGGTPCQGFSFAGKQLAFSDPRSKLFFDFIKILDHIKKLNPDVKFLLENVNMKKEFLNVISEYCGVYPVRINSRLVSAQNRDRYYWTNIKTRTEGIFYQEVYADIPQPKDEGLLLRDILEDDVDEKYYIRNPKIGFKGMNINYKSNTLRTGGAKSQSDKHNCDFIKIDKNGNPKANQEKASCFTAGAHSGGNHSDMDFICVAMRGRNPDNPTSRIAGLPTEQRLEANMSGKTNCLTSVSKDNLVMQLGRGKNKGGYHKEKTPTLSANSWEQNNLVIQLNNSTESGGKQPYQHNRIYSDEGKMICLDTGKRKNVYTNHRIRRLTPKEASRLQTIPDWYEWVVSDTQIYKMCGNGWTVKVIMWILGFLNK
ncbi:DNA (cytosine-5-)-methyltransferase [Dysgonomonas sp. 511]|uniref:DNA (cytosine-5-)-methyltransferase n=1 Tax=Dysgonomonas sp. 511 TaxID=2302930 RepID=UPI0013D66C4F|nr:DNA (cytosine-5-)-methyltransferase [Dysgonomonas sp. 511]